MPDRIYQPTDTPGIYLTADPVLDQHELKEANPWNTVASFSIPFAVIAALFTILSGWESGASILILATFQCVWVLQRKHLARSGVNTAGTIVNKMQDGEAYLIQFSYIVDGIQYVNTNPDVWFEISGRVYNDNTVVQVRYLPRNPAVCLPRYTVYMRTKPEGGFMARGYWYVLGLYLIFLVAFVVIFRLLVNLSGDLDTLLATFLACSAVSILCFLYFYSTERHERFTAVGPPGERQENDVEMGPAAPQVDSETRDGNASSEVDITDTPEEQA